MSQSVLHNVVCGKKLLRSFSPTNHFTSWLILKDWENRTTNTQQKKTKTILVYRGICSVHGCKGYNMKSHYEEKVTKHLDDMLNSPHRIESLSLNFILYIDHQNMKHKEQLQEFFSDLNNVEKFENLGRKK
jgi:hypothetical protein